MNDKIKPRKQTKDTMKEEVIKIIEQVNIQLDIDD